MAPLLARAIIVSSSQVIIVSSAQVIIVVVVMLVVVVVGCVVGIDSVVVGVFFPAHLSTSV